ncbi:MAG TPA: hypothetical protein VNV25_07675 [Gemmatimonadaceae bacterium]|jgi:hypothetical protein|nr:hypothetical protein [Gemmatimonadaceae bacterium]
MIAHTFVHAEEQTADLLRLLERHAIKVQPGSVLEAMFLNVFNVSYRKAGELAADRTADIRAHFSDFMGLTELAGQLTRVANMPGFNSLIPHLRLLNAPQPLQNRPSSALDQQSRKIFELLVATWAMNCGGDVELDNPDHSLGDNPDVLITVDGRRWGFACKVLQRFHAEGFLEHLRKGIAQIEASPAHVGAVVFNLKNVLEHNRYWRIVNEKEWESGAEPRFSCFEEPHAPYTLLKSELEAIGTKLREHAGQAPFAGCFTGDKTISGYLLWGHTTSAVLLDGVPTVAGVRCLNLQYVQPVTGWRLDALESLGRAAQTDH